MIDKHITVKVSSKSNPSSVAGSIAGFIREHRDVELKAIGAGAVNNAVKALAITRGFVASMGKDLSVIPAFDDIQIDGKPVSAIKLIVKV